uniref:Secreted protein n=1 Tax=Streptomyces sp. NBC_01401 TaxID=2903854 RepID=A0AAU3H1D1_9ACTN
MEAVILILTLLFVAFMALGVYAGVKTVRAAKRGVDRTVTQARRSVENTALWAKSYGQPGVQGELAQLRLTLRTSMRATQDALNAGVAQDGSLSESLGLFRRLSVHGHELDDELKRLEREPDRATVASLLPGLKERTEHITHSAESLRWAARDRAKRFADDDLSALKAQIDLEAGALRHWTTEEPAAPDGTTGRSWGGPADAETASSATPSSATPSSATPPRPASPPPSLTAPDARLRQGYPWQKSARPETTN